MAQRKTLLIVDDDQDLRGAIAEQLQAEGFETLEAATAGEGVRLAHAVPGGGRLDDVEPLGLQLFGDRPTKVLVVVDDEEGLALSHARQQTPS